MNRPLPVDMSARNRDMVGIVDEDLAFLEVEQRLTVGRGEMLRGEP